MQKYDNNDVVEFYFIIMSEKNGKRIQAWTDNKDLAKCYYEFHNCKHFTLKRVSKPLIEMYKVIEENINDEIQIANIKIKNRDRKSKKDEEYIILNVPATRTEMTFINEESATFLLSQLNYSYLDSAIPYLKDKYQEALKDIFLVPILQKVVYNKDSRVSSSIELDQLMVLLKSFPDMFN